MRGCQAGDEGIAKDETSFAALHYPADYINLAPICQQYLQGSLSSPQSLTYDTPQIPPPFMCLVRPRRFLKAQRFRLVFVAVNDELETVTQRMVIRTLSCFQRGNNPYWRLYSKGKSKLTRFSVCLGSWSTVCLQQCLTRLLKTNTNKNFEKESC